MWWLTGEIGSRRFAECIRAGIDVGQEGESRGVKEESYGPKEWQSTLGYATGFVRTRQKKGQTNKKFSVFLKMSRLWACEGS